MSGTRVTLLLAHPRAGSFNHAIAERAAATCRDMGATVRVHDLYAEGFDPLLRPEEAYTSGQSARAVLAATDDPLVQAHRAEIATTDVLIAVHPNWWGKPPAILGGWLDRVLVPGVAYRLDTAGGAPEPLLAVRHLIVFNTSDTPAGREESVFGDPLAAIWGRCIVPYIGNPAFTRTVFRVVSESTPAERQQWLGEVEDVIRSRLVD